MKLKKIKITVSSIQDVLTDFKKSLAGTPIVKKNEINFPSLSDVADAFTANRLTIMRAIIIHKPTSIYGLAKILNRDFKNVWNDVSALEQMGIIELKKTEGTRGQIKPIALYSGVEIDLAA